MASKIAPNSFSDLRQFTVMVLQRIIYKLATLVHKCLTGRAPAYLAEYYRQAGTRRPGM